MAHIDKFIQAMQQKPGSVLQFTANREPMLVMGGREAPLLAKKANPGQVRHILAEIVGKTHRAQIESRDGTEFEYRPPGMEPVWITISNWRGNVEAVIRPSSGMPPAPPPTSPIGFDEPGGLPRGVGAGAAPLGVAPVAEPARDPFEVEPGDVPFHNLLRVLVEQKGSDLHCSSEEIPMIRKDGEMVRLDGFPTLDSDRLWELLKPIVPERNEQDFLETNDSDFAYELEGVARFRANLFRDRKGVGAVFRTIPATVLSASTLGLPKAVTDFGQLSKGLVLVTGPTGSGKSTTLAAIIDHINETRGGHLITIEDPVEFVHQNKRCLVNQREVHVHTQSFKRALRAALREDPDIILVGEMRDLETIAIAIETAETGHLVFGTLHTTTAYSTVDRIIDQFPTDQQEQIRVMLSESLKGVVSQTLCKKIGGGRVAALEILICNKAVANLIREGKTFQIPSVMQTGRNVGMRLLNDALFELVKGGLVEPNEAFVKAVDKGSFATMLKSAGIELE